MHAPPWLRTCGLAVTVSGAGLAVFWPSGELVPLLAATSAVFFCWGRGPGLLSVGICGVAAGVSLLADERVAAAESQAYLHLALFVSSAVAVGFLIQDSQRSRASKREKPEPREIVESIPGLAWTAGVDGRLTGMNAAFRKYLEIAGADEFRLRDAIHPDDVAHVMDLWSGSLKTGAEFHSAHRIRGADGAYRWFRAAARPKCDRAGGVAGWYGTLVDIDDQKLAEETLRASEVSLRSILDNIPGMIATADADGNYNYGNKRNLDYLGLNLPELAGQRWLTIIHPEERGHVSAAWRRAVQMGEPMIIVHRLRRHDDEYRWFHVHVEPIRGENGKVLRWYGLITDIHDRKRAEEALRTSQRELQLLVDTIPTLVWSITPEGEPAYINKRLETYYGRKMDGRQAVDGSGLSRSLQVLMHPDDREAIRRNLMHSLSTGESFAMRYRNRRADGVYRWVDARAEPLRDDTGRIVQWYGVSVDIDDQEKAEEALRARERQLQLLIDTIPALVWCATPEGVPSYASKRLMDYAGLSSQDPEGPSRTELDEVVRNTVHPDDAAAVTAHLAHSLATGESLATRYRIRRADGVYSWVDARAEPLRDDDGRIVQWYCVLVDIDDETRAQDALRAAQERLSRASQLANLAELSASIAHEVNQPLAAVITNSHACQRWLLADPPNMQRALVTSERIVRDAMAAAEVVGRIRALFTRTASTRAAIDINEVIGEVGRLMTEEIASEGVLVETDLDAALPPAPADRVQMQQVLVNLIRNGIDAMKSNGDAPKSLVIGSRRDGDNMILVEIRDNGCGIAEPGRIFEPFFTTKEKGMGMGLAICRSILESHDGRLWAESVRPRGTVFSFTLPIHLRDVT